MRLLESAGRTAGSVPHSVPSVLIGSCPSGSPCLSPWSTVTKTYPAYDTYLFTKARLASLRPPVKVVSISPFAFPDSVTDDRATPRRPKRERHPPRGSAPTPAAPLARWALTPTNACDRRRRCSAIETYGGACLAGHEHGDVGAGTEFIHGEPDDARRGVARARQLRRPATDLAGGPARRRRTRSRAVRSRPRHRGCPPRSTSAAAGHRSAGDADTSPSRPPPDRARR